MQLTIRKKRPALFPAFIRRFRSFPAASYIFPVRTQILPLPRKKYRFWEVNRYESNGHCTPHRRSISPAVAIAVCLGTTVGFFLTTNPLIALRALSHIVFATLGARYLVKHPQVIEKPVSSTLFNAVLALCHALCEVISVTPFFLMGTQFKAEQLSNGFFQAVVLMIGVVAFFHSMIDYAISIAIWKPLSRVVRAAERT